MNYMHQLDTLKNNPKLLIIPSSIFIISAIFFSLLYHAISRYDRESTQVSVEHVLSILELSIKTKLEEQIKALFRMKQRLNNQPTMALQAWKDDAGNYTHDMQAVRSLKLITNNGTTVENIQAHSHDLSCAPQLSTKNRDIYFISGPNLCAQYAVTFENAPALLIATLHIPAFVQSSTAGHLFINFGMQITYRGNEIYSYLVQNTKVMDKWSNSKKINIQGIYLTLSAWPTEQYIKERFGYIPITVLLIGIFASLFIAIASGYYLLSNLKQKEIILSEQRQKLLFDSITDYAIFMLDRNGCIISWNKGAEYITGYNANDFRSKHFLMLNPSSDKPEKPPAYELEMALKNGRYEEQGWRLKKNGKQFWVNTVINPIYVERKLLGFCKITRDVTSQKEAEELKDEFISVVNHELRTPLTAIRGSIGLILAGTEGPVTQDMSNLLSISDKNCERLLLLINDMLDIGKLDNDKISIDIKRVNLKEIVNQTVALNAEYAKKYDVDINVIAPIDEVSILIDPSRFIQVFTNLLSNAVKYTENPKRVDIYSTKVNDQIRVCVKDFGPGIPENYRDNIFKKFSQVPSDSVPKEGTGLGLYISKELINKMGGEINYTSIPDKETIFYIELPIA